MKSYWIWLLLNILVWVLAIVSIDQTISEMIWKLFGLSIYFTLFFLIPLVSKKSEFFAAILGTQLILSGLILFPVDEAFNFFLLLIISLIIAEGFYHLPSRFASPLSGLGFAIFLSNILFADFSFYQDSFFILVILMIILALFIFKATKNQSDDLNARYLTLLSEYRDLKRKNISEEEMARQEERVLIAHEIHDSVGHKLTALLMQLEMVRLHAPQENQEQMNTLKKLADESLAETRKAVKSLKATDAGGLTGIMRLIRKMEKESFIDVHFSVKHGAFTAPLTGEQSFVVYRAAQEALTNVMKHSHAREASIHFEAPGGRVFRFEISNPTYDNEHRFKEGFGLTSMRERLEKFGGQLEVYQSDNRFVVIGTIKIGYGGEADDSGAASGRPSDGQTGTENDD